METKLLQTITDVQANFLRNPEMSRFEAFDVLLKVILEYTKSEFGFIGEIKFDETVSSSKTGAKPKAYLQTWAITDIAWDRETSELYNSYKHRGLRF